MDEFEAMPEAIRIVVDGEAKPYRERTHTYRRRTPGRQADDTGRYFSFRPRLEIDIEPVMHCQLQADELVLEEGGTSA